MHGKYGHKTTRTRPALYLCGIEKSYSLYAIKHTRFLIARCHPGSEGIHSFRSRLLIIAPISQSNRAGETSPDPISRSVVGSTYYADTHRCTYVRTNVRYIPAGRSFPQCRRILSCDRAQKSKHNGYSRSLNILTYFELTDDSKGCVRKALIYILSLDVLGVFLFPAFRVLVEEFDGFEDFDENFCILQQVSEASPVRLTVQLRVELT